MSNPTKTTRRCKITFNKGKPGILVKPHINPMTGDSYNSRSVGNWFKKSSFARNIVPRLKLRALRKSSTDSSYYAEVEITNPQDEIVAVRVECLPEDIASRRENALCLTVPDNDHEILVGAYDELLEQDEVWASESEATNKLGASDPPWVVERRLNYVVLDMKVEGSIHDSIQVLTTSLRARTGFQPASAGQGDAESVEAPLIGSDSFCLAYDVDFVGLDTEV